MSDSPVSMPFCFLIQNFAEIWHSINELWPKKRFSRWRPPPSWIPGSISDAVYQISSKSDNFSLRWRFNDFQNSGRPPSYILKICSFCPAALVSIPSCFLIQNLAEIGQSADDLWPKKRFQFLVTWLLPNSISDVVYQISSKSDNFSLTWWFNDFQNGGRPPSFILKICSFYHVALVDIPFCFLIQNFAELKSVNRLMSYDQKSDFQDGGRRHLEF